MSINRKVRKPGTWTAIAALLATGFAQGVHAAPGSLIGGPVKIGSTPGIYAVYLGGPLVASDADGNMVATWIAYPSNAVVAQRFDASGKAVGSAIQVAAQSTTAPDQLSYPNVAVNASGQFVIAWTDVLPSKSAAPHAGVKPDLRINWPDGPIAMHARTFNADGTSLSDDILFANMPVSSLPHNPASVAIDDAGDFVVGWLRGSESPIVQTQGPQIFTQTQDAYVRVYSAAGKPKTQPIKVDGGRATKPWFGKPLVGNLPEAIAVGMDGTGNFTAAWKEDQFTSPSVPSSTVSMQNFSATGKAMAPAVQVDHDTDYDTLTVAIAMNRTGQYALTYSCASTQGTTTLCAQTFQPGGVAVSGPFNVFTNGSPSDPSIESSPTVAIDASGDFIIGALANICDGAGACSESRAVRLFTFDGKPKSQNIHFPYSSPDPMVSAGLGMDANGDAEAVYYGAQTGASQIYPVLLQRISGN